MEDKLINRYRYALCNGHIISIDDVTIDNRKSSKFTCIGCGREMVAALGEVREHYFRHKSHESCSNETYLHELAKRKIKEIFDEQDHFYIVYNANNTCTNYDSCPFHSCNKDYKQNLDLKEYFDTCEIEKGCGKFRPDILLSHSEISSRKLFIEINVHHPCSEEKLKSGFRIIEIDVNSEQTVIYPFNEDFGHIHFFKFDFNRSIIPHKKLKRFSVIKNGNEIEYKMNVINCDKYKEHLENTLFDLILLNEDKANEFPLLGFSECMKRKITVRNCLFCKQYYTCKRLIFPKRVIDKETGLEKYVEERKSPKDCEFSSLWKAAELCHFFNANLRGCNMLINNFGKQNFILWENEDQ